jgi:hypothetical protein
MNSHPESLNLLIAPVRVRWFNKHGYQFGSVQQPQRVLCESPKRSYNSKTPLRVLQEQWDEPYLGCRIATSRSSYPRYLSCHNSERCSVGGGGNCELLKKSAFKRHVLPVLFFPVIRLTRLNRANSKSLNDLKFRILNVLSIVGNTGYLSLKPKSLVNVQKSCPRSVAVSQVPPLPRCAV